jgi:DNA mismatch endonuclease (patch repair protein)
LTDVHNREARSRNMAAIKGANTRPEMVVRRMLHCRGFRYVLHDRKLPGRPDLVFPSRRKVVFVNGCFWHMHDCRYGRVVPATRTAFWQAKRAGNVVRDAANLKTLAEQGWQALVAWECELREPEALMTRLVSFLGENAHGRDKRNGGNRARMGA